MEERTTVQFTLLTTKTKSLWGTDLLDLVGVSIFRLFGKNLGVFVSSIVRMRRRAFCALRNGRGSSNWRTLSYHIIHPTTASYPIPHHPFSSYTGVFSHPTVCYPVLDFSTTYSYPNLLRNEEVWKLCFMGLLGGRRRRSIWLEQSGSNGRLMTETVRMVYSVWCVESEPVDTVVCVHAYTYLMWWWLQRVVRE